MKTFGITAKYSVIFLFALGIFVRLYNFSNRTLFTLEQGLTLSTTYDYLHDKFSLLGLPNVQRFTSDGLRIFSGPLYNYALMPVMALLGNDPVTLTFTAFAINILTAITLFFLIRDLSGRRIAFFTTLFFLFSPTMIGQAQTIWILNPLPLVGLLAMYLLITFSMNMPLKVSFALGVLSGISISLEWMMIFSVAAVFLYLIVKSTNKTKDGLVFLIGATIPLLPTIIFDFRHDWYHLRTLWQYSIDTVANPGQSKFALYHLFHLLPLWFYMLGKVVNKVAIEKPWLGYSAAALYAVVGSVQSFRTVPRVPTPTLMEIGSQIASIAEKHYNVVYMPDSDYQAYALRYILRVVNQKPPMAVEDYPNARELYVVAMPDRSLDRDIPWEISSFKSTNRELIYTSHDAKVLLFRLTK